VYFVNVLGAPEEADWGGHDGTISIIQRELAVPDGSRDMIKQTLADVVECHSKGVAYSAGRKDGFGGGSKLSTRHACRPPCDRWCRHCCSLRRQAGEDGPMLWARARSFLPAQRSATQSRNSPDFIYYWPSTHEKLKLRVRSYNEQALRLAKFELDRSRPPKIMILLCPNEQCGIREGRLLTF